jgi:hypothetical protein
MQLNNAGVGNPKKKGRGSHSPLLEFLNRSKYVIHLWNRPGNMMSWNNIIGFFESTWQRINGYIGLTEWSPPYQVKTLAIPDRRNIFLDFHLNYCIVTKIAMNIFPGRLCY